MLCGKWYDQTIAIDSVLRMKRKMQETIETCSKYLTKITK